MASTSLLVWEDCLKAVYTAQDIYIYTHKRDHQMSVPRMKNDNCKIERDLPNSKTTDAVVAASRAVLMCQDLS
jgi:hypothetical protein